MSTQLNVRAITTDVFHKGDKLIQFICNSLVGSQGLVEKDILAVTSKIVSLAENQTAPIQIDKQTIVEEEADIYLGHIGYGCHLTIKHGLLIPSAGIDESNSENGDYILFPKDPFASAHKLWLELREHYKIKDLGILITDSHTTPLRRGVTGIALAHWGFVGVKKLVGKPDIFQRLLKMTQVNYADALAVAAVMTMGEADEQTPLAIVQSNQVEFTTNTNKDECKIPLEEDLYSPLLAPRIQGKTNPFTN